MSYEGTSLVVEDVPADICDTCGELYFDEHVTQRLLDLAREGGEPSREIYPSPSMRSHPVALAGGCSMATSASFESPIGLQPATTQVSIVGHEIPVGAMPCEGYPNSVGVQTALAKLSTTRNGSSSVCGTQASIATHDEML